MLKMNILLLILIVMNLNTKAVSTVDLSATLDGKLITKIQSIETVSINNLD